MFLTGELPRQFDLEDRRTRRRAVRSSAATSDSEANKLRIVILRFGTARQKSVLE
jgi:hypothetical protein